MVIVSACLLGENCKYNGGNNECQWVLDFVRSNKHKCILVCPEIDIFSVPRPPVEILDGRAVNKDGKDVTDGLIEGAEKEWEKATIAAKGQKIEQAILKANSPSCGCGTIYDGTFSGKLVDGDGFFTKLLKEKGIKVITEKETI
jgi:uncharacterized protein YbbK (DUF523 family)